MKNVISFLSGALLMLVICFFYYEKPLLPEPTLMERYNLTEEEAQVIEDTVAQVEADMAAKTGKAVDLDISDLDWIEDPKEYAQFVIQMEEALFKLENQTLDSLEELAERISLIKNASYIKNSLTTLVHSEFDMNNITEEEKNELLLLIDNIVLPTLEELAADPTSEPTADEIKMHLINTIEQNLNDPNYLDYHVLSDADIEKMEMLKLMILKTDATAMDSEYTEE